MRRTLYRNGYIFEVDDGPETASWDFWRLWAEGIWESAPLAAVERLIPRAYARRRFLDIGAWQGPFTLWAAALGAEVWAIEPDPAAYHYLKKNVDLSFPRADNIHLTNSAAMLDTHGAGLHSVGGWGSSSPSVTQDIGELLWVPSIDIVDFAVKLMPTPVKMDIEGGEYLIFPALGPVLRSLGIPLLLGHHYWMAGQQPTLPFEEELYKWSVEVIATNDMGRDLILRPK